MAKKPSKKSNAVASEPDPKAALDATAFLAAVQPIRRLLEEDLLTRARGSRGVVRAMASRHAAEQKARRTGDDFDSWQRHFVEQVAAAWILSVVFVRVLEDRGLLDRNRIAGPGAADSLKLFLQLAPSLSERDYLLHVFKELAHFPAVRALFDAKHNPIWLLAPSAEASKQLLALFRSPSVDAPTFRFGSPNTRFLGDLYQDLSEDVRKRYALLQTPHFVESYILDRTLDRALAKFGIARTTLLDPTCGSGHFLLGAFDRLVEAWRREEPGIAPREAARRALDAIAGADLNPYAVAIARFRLMLAALEVGGYAKLEGAHAPIMHLAVADSLLHGTSSAPQLDFAAGANQRTADWRGAVYALDDEPSARDVLDKRYTAVVGNPPYITVKDAVVREELRARYPRSAAGKYALAAPFTERFFQLASQGGCVGMINANSFMKREFGKKLIEQMLPTVSLDGIVNTSGAYIPGHGTPTVMLFGTNEPPRDTDVLTVLAKRGEPSTPDDAAQGLVWRSIIDYGSEVGYDDDYITVARVTRETLEKHPWSLGGGGAAELKELLEERSEKTLGELVDSIGFMAITGEDDAFVYEPSVFARQRLPCRIFGYGEAVRDYAVAPTLSILFPYTDVWGPEDDPRVIKWLWPLRQALRQRLMFGKTNEQVGNSWWEYRHVGREKIKTPLTITFAEVATHNHFVLDRGGKVFKQTAPIIKLPPTATEDDHLALLAYLNSSTACFWLKQACQNKGSGGARGGSLAPRLRPDEWAEFVQYSGTRVGLLPLPPNWQSLANLGRSLANRDIRTDFAAMVAEQETLDWHVYQLFGLEFLNPAVLEHDNTLRAGDRPFEIVLLREHPTTQWFARNDYVPPTDTQSPTTRLRLDAITADPNLALIEQPEYKRRWTVPESDDVIAAVKEHNELLSAFEKTLGAVSLVQATRLHEPQTSWIRAEAIPFLAAYRHTEAGLENRAAWERTWALQRREDAGEAIANIPVPPKYDQKDYREANGWRLRGKLDVPKERFIAYPGCESDEDHEPVYGWAGWDHLQQAQALVALFQDRKTREEWAAERLTPMLAGLLELLPWLLQWHDEPSAQFDGERPGQAYERFLDAECRELGLTREALRAWRPSAKKAAARGKKKAAAKAASSEAAEQLTVDDEE